MRKTRLIICSLLACSLLAGAYLSAPLFSNATSSYVMENVDALTDGESNSGVIIECSDEICIIVDYKNRLLVSGCKRAEDYICKCQKTELPGINL